MVKKKSDPSPYPLHYDTCLWLADDFQASLLIGCWELTEILVWVSWQFPPPDMCAEKCLLTSMGGQKEGQACADQGARNPICVSGHFNKEIKKTDMLYEKL